MTLTVRLTAIAVGSVLLVGAPVAAATAGPGGIGPVPTTLAVTPSSGPAYRAVTITVVAARGGDASGTTRGAVTIRDGASLLARDVPLVDGQAAVTTNALGPGPHQITAELTGAARAARPVSGPVLAAFDGAAASADTTVVLTIPPGSLTITSAAAYRPRLADMVITDTRPGNLGFTASVVAGPILDGSGGEYAGARAGLVHLSADQVPGNALRARDVRVSDIRPGSPGLGAPRGFARYPAGLSTGSAHVQGTLAVRGLPAAVRGERLRTTLTFTVM